jgi:hypothetical protein
MAVSLKNYAEHYFCSLRQGASKNAGEVFQLFQLIAAVVQLNAGSNSQGRGSIVDFF